MTDQTKPIEFEREGRKFQLFRSNTGGDAGAVRYTWPATLADLSIAGFMTIDEAHAQQAAAEASWAKLEAGACERARKTEKDRVVWQLEARSLAADVIRAEEHGRLGERDRHMVAAARRVNERAATVLGPGRPSEETLAAGDHAIVTGIALRHGERVLLKVYSSIEDRWYCELTNGTIVRFAPEQLTKDSGQHQGKSVEDNPDPAHKASIGGATTPSHPTGTTAGNVTTSYDDPDRNRVVGSGAGRATLVTHAEARRAGGYLGGTAYDVFYRYLDQQEQTERREEDLREQNRALTRAASLAHDQRNAAAEERDALRDAFGEIADAVNSESEDLGPDQVRQRVVAMETERDYLRSENAELNAKLAKATESAEVSAAIVQQTQGVHISWVHESNKLRAENADLKTKVGTLQTALDEGAELVGELKREEPDGAKCKYCNRAGCESEKYRDDARLLRMCRHAVQLERDFLANRVGRVKAGMRDLVAENAELKAGIESILQLSEPWPLRDTLLKLAEATNILLRDHSYDGLGWELIGRARLDALAAADRLSRHPFVKQSPAPGVPAAGVDSSAEKPPEAAPVFHVAADNPGAGEPQSERLQAALATAGRYIEALQRPRAYTTEELLGLGAEWREARKLNLQPEATSHDAGEPAAQPIELTTIEEIAASDEAWMRRTTIDPDLWEMYQRYVSAAVQMVGGTRSRDRYLDEVIPLVRILAESVVMEPIVDPDAAAAGNGGRAKVTASEKGAAQ